MERQEADAADGCCGSHDMSVLLSTAQRLGGETNIGKAHLLFHERGIFAEWSRDIAPGKCHCKPAGLCEDEYDTWQFLAIPKYSVLSLARDSFSC